MSSASYNKISHHKKEKPKSKRKYLAFRFAQHIRATIDSTKPCKCLNKGKRSREVTEESRNNHLKLEKKSSKQGKDGMTEKKNLR